MDKIFWIQLITSALGSVGFAVLFKVRLRYLGIIAFLGGACYGVYYLFESGLSSDAFIAALVSTAFVALVSEILARIVHTPTIVFLISCIIPIVPGSYLYRAMRGLIERNSDAFLQNGAETLKIALGTAGGIVAVSVIVNVVLGIAEKVRKKKNEG